MPIEYKIVSGVAVARCWGDVSIDDIKRVIGDYVDDPRLSKPHRELFDLRDVGSFSIGYDGVQDVTEFVKSTGERFSRGKVAYVASRDMPYGIGRIFEVFAESVDIELKAFRNLGDACDWLGLPLDAVEGGDRGGG